MWNCLIDHSDENCLFFFGKHSWDTQHKVKEMFQLSCNGATSASVTYAGWLLTTQFMLPQRVATRPVILHERSAVEKM